MFIIKCNNGKQYIKSSKYTVTSDLWPQTIEWKTFSDENPGTG